MSGADLNSPLPTYVVDTDCINHLLDTIEGRVVLKNIRIKIPPSIYNELTGKKQELFSKITHVEIVDLDNDDKLYAAKLIRKINQKKEFADWYLQGRRLREINQIGECEGAALARKYNVTLVLLDRSARSVIRIAFQHVQSKTADLVVFGVKILTESGNASLVSKFENEMNIRLHRYSKKESKAN